MQPTLQAPKKKRVKKEQKSQPNLGNVSALEDYMKPPPKKKVPKKLDDPNRTLSFAEMKELER